MEQRKLRQGHSHDKGVGYGDLDTREGKLSVKEMH